MLIDIQAELQPLLVGLQRHCKVAEATVAADGIAAVERHLGRRIPPLLGAVLAVSGTPPFRLIELDEELERFYRAEDQPGWRKAAGFDHLAFVGWGEWPRQYGCFDRRARPAIFSLKSGTFETASLADIVTRAWPGVLPGVGELVVEVVGPVAAAPRRVLHPTFGEGTVIGAAAGKLTIDFGPHGHKVLLARFVRDL
jgi:hypothetical protein